MDASRERAIIDSLVAMADNLVADFDVVDMLTNLAHRCVTVLGVSAAGVMLASPAEELRLVASSSEAMRVVELFELQADEGPCLDAYHTGVRIEQDGLQAGTGRWPRFSLVAMEAGFRSVTALPLRLRERTVGALNLFNVQESPMDDHDVMVAQAFADLATISVLQHGAVADSQRINEQLTQALTSRVVIEQAKGVIAERAGVGIDEAFVRLRNYARAHNLRLVDVAGAAIGGTLPPAAWRPPAPEA